MATSLKAILTKTSGSAELWSFAALSCKLGSGLIMLPLAARMLPPAEFGLWYVFISIGSFAWVVEFGFGGSVTRGVATFWSGADSLQEFGLATKPVLLDSPNLGGAIAYLSTIRLLYRGLAATFLGCALLASTILIPWRETGHSGVQHICAWVIFVVASAFLCYSRWQPAFLLGTGAVRAVQRIDVAGSAIYLAIGTVLLLVDFGLLALAIAQMAQAVFTRLVLAASVNRTLGTPLVNPSWCEARSTLALIWPMTWRQGAVTLGNYLISNGPILIAANLLGLAQTAQYGITMQVLQLLQNLAAIPLNARLPTITIKAARGELIAVNYLAFSRIGIALAAFVPAGIVAMLAGNSALRLMGSQSQLLPLEACGLALLLRFFELNQALFAKLCHALNRNDFAGLSLATAVATPLAAFIFAKRYGLFGMLIAIVRIQLAYSNWAPVRCAARVLGHSVVELYRMTLKHGIHFLTHLAGRKVPAVSN